MLEPRFQASPRQWLMIGLLAAALIAVLVMNLSGDSVEPAVGLAVQPPANDAGSAAAASPVNAARLPQFTAEEVARFNPFARSDSPLPAAAASDAVDSAAVRKRQQEKVLADLRTAGVRFIIGDAEGGTAMLGNQRIRTGDIVSGFRVIKIDPSGVELEPAE
jgi:hypothetical protein